ncbi:hypothetical protein SLEP1_g31933 [Rubroshorea leprosula]|uniref:Uncharacterized protein n=1 Tax=Rubroshorea leprosula TaxID=152421 RepID=A0AAV5KBT2_9ROSI|nr:hypothetical protein SLEP1_g31933 [Rubroshorea leprosula]
MASLVTLDLSFEFLMVGGSLKLENPNLVMLVWNLKELIHLYLDGINISAQGKEWCQANLSSSLLNLQLAATNLQEVPEKIFQVLTLKTQLIDQLIS